MTQKATQTPEIPEELQILLNKHELTYEQVDHAAPQFLQNLKDKLTAKANIPDWITQLPKAEHHIHIGGSQLPETIIDLAKQQKITLPSEDPEELKTHIVYSERVLRKIKKGTFEGLSLSDYLAGFPICESVMASEDAIVRAAYETCKQVHKSGAVICEPRFAPQNYLKSGLNLNQIVESALEGLKQASKKFNMLTGLILCGIKPIRKNPNQPIDSSTLNRAIAKIKEVAEVAAQYKRFGVCGLDLAGPEKDNLLKYYVNAIKRATDTFLNKAIHAGEEDTVRSIAEAINALGGRRIGHALTIDENNDLYDHALTARIGFEMCQTSNLDTSNVSSYMSHPIRVNLLGGLRVFPCTDNPTISDTTLDLEYYLAMKYQNFTREQMFTLAENSIKASFSTEIDPYLKRLDDFYEKQTGIKVVRPF